MSRLSVVDDRSDAVLYSGYRAEILVFFGVLGSSGYILISGPRYGLESKFRLCG